MRIDYMQLEFINKTLRLILEDIEEKFGEQTITSLYRIGDYGVHGQLPLRGVDLRCRYLYTGRQIAGYVNKRWEYDRMRPEMQCCICHDVGQGLHLHIQSNPNTRRRE